MTTKNPGLLDSPRTSSGTETRVAPDGVAEDDVVART
jgi:hypothetical protein